VSEVRRKKSLKSYVWANSADCFADIARGAETGRSEIRRFEREDTFQVSSLAATDDLMASHELKDAFSCFENIKESH
jgi:hypothetical protein